MSISVLTWPYYDSEPFYSDDSCDDSHGNDAGDHDDNWHDLWRVGILVSRSLLNWRIFATFQDAVEGVTYVRPGVHCVEVTLSEGDGGGLKYDLTLTSSDGHPFLEIRCWGCE